MPRLAMPNHATRRNSTGQALDFQAQRCENTVVKKPCLALPGPAIPGLTPPGLAPPCLAIPRHAGQFYKAGHGLTRAAAPVWCWRRWR